MVQQDGGFVRKTKAPELSPANIVQNPDVVAQHSNSETQGGRPKGGRITWELMYAARWQELTCVLTHSLSINL